MNASDNNLVFVSDSAVNVSIHLDALQVMAANGTLASIIFTDSGTPILDLSAAQITDDAGALAHIGGPYIVDPTAAEATNAATFPNVVAVGVDDTAANVIANLDALQALAVAGKLSFITFTDGSIPSLTLSVAQENADAAALALIKSAYILVLHGPVDQYRVADDGGSLYIQDTVAGRDGTQILQATTQMAFTNGVGILDPTGTAEDVARLYQALLQRAPDVGGLLAWTASIDNSHVPLSAVANSFATSPEFIQTYGSLSDDSFIQKLYQNSLGRPADAAGEQAWDNALASGMSRGQVALGFAESPENRVNTGSIAGDKNDAEAYRLYKAALARTPDQAGQLAWSSVLAGGATPSQVAQGFIDSAEFQQKYGGLSTQDFVSTLYQNALNRPADAAGLQAWTTALQGGMSKADVLVGFSDSLENRVQTAAATHDGWVFIHT